MFPDLISTAAALLAAAPTFGIVSLLVSAAVVAVWALPWSEAELDDTERDVALLARRLLGSGRADGAGPTAARTAVKLCAP